MKGLGIFVAPIASERDFISASSHGEISEQQSCRSSLETGFDPLSPTSFANARFVVDPFDTPPTSAAFESSRPHSPLVLPSLSREQHQTMELPGQQRPFLKPSFTPPASSTSSPSVSVLRLPVASSSSFDSPPPRPSAPTPGSAASLQVLPCGSPSFPSSENISTTGSAYPTPPKIAKIAHTPKSKSSPRSTTSTQSRYQLWRFNPSPRSSHLRASNHRPNRRRSSSVSSRTYDSWPLGQSGFNDHRCQQTPPCLLVSQQIPPPQPYAASLSRSPVLGSSQAENYPTCSASSHRFGSTADSPQPHRPPHWSPPVRPGAPSPDDSPEKAQYLQSCFKTPSSSWQSIASGGSPILNPSTSRSPYSRRRLEPSPSYSPRFRRTPCAASLVWSPQTPSRAAYLQASASTVLSCYHNAARPAAPSPGESPEQVHYLKSLFVATSPSVSSLCFLAPPSSHSCSLLPSSSTFLSFASLTPLIPSSPPTGSPTSFQERPESVHDIDTDLWFRYVARRREDKAFEINLYKMIFMLKRVHHGERVGANLGREQALMKLEGRHHESKRLTSERERSERMSMEDGRRAVRYVTRNLWVKLGMMEGVDDRVLEEFGEVAEDEEDEPDWDEVYDRRLEKGKSRAEGEMEHDQENNEVIDGGDEGSMVDADSIAIDEGDDDTDEHGFSIDKCLAMLLSSIQPNPRWAPPIHDDLHVQEQMLRFWRRDMALLDIYEQNFL
ncbi:hypothetical protein JAAARDRAFT_206974 [Jaapia argillacea MUCL 33604]|uniref:Uncharacterized protein n=1 Tax=Jaapia argillacea MUCL 33604 TaxID=933084 RepID=A0A067PRI9_9AGAM|nr:hypothetical protein JAAARDRAFT_206974 [Jaapia argillacea MUCL 33604]